MLFLHCKHVLLCFQGYFQLKATPGIWHLMIRPGRSNDIYSVARYTPVGEHNSQPTAPPAIASYLSMIVGVVSYSHEMTDSPSDSSDIVVVMDSFKSRIVSLRVRKRPGMDGVDLLADEAEDEAEGGGIWDSISKLVLAYTSLWLAQSAAGPVCS